MLAKLGCSYVVVGHSERREHHAESDATVNAKAKKAIAAGDDADRVRRRGPRGAHRRAGTSSTPWSSSTARWPAWTRARSRELVVAYEPVWAIGTGEVATPDDAQEVCSAIRARVAEAWSAEAAASVRMLYGGSVKAANVAGIMEKADVDGCLVGGASLQADEFGGICRYYDMPVI